MKRFAALLPLVFFLGLSRMATAADELARFSSKPNDWFASFEFRARPAEAPHKVETVVVILTQDIAGLDKELLDPKWERLAKDKSIGMVALGFNEQKKAPEGSKAGTKPLSVTDPLKARSLLHEELKRQIGEHFPKASKFGYVARGAACGMACGIAGGEPKETRFWAIEDHAWEVPADIRSLPPGLVINRDGGKLVRMLECHQKNRLNKVDITFVRNPTKEREAVDKFVVDFITSIVSPAPTHPVVADLESEVSYSSRPPREKMASTTWLPDVSLMPAWQALHVFEMKQRLATVVKESVETGVASQPQLHLYLKTPTTLKAGEKLKGVVCIASWMQEEKSMNDILRHGAVCKRLVDWADANQMAVVTWNTATLWKAGTSQADLAREDARHMDKNFDAIAAAWEKCMRRLIGKYGLPENGYLIYGISRGSHWGHRLVLRKPERFSAAHFHIANSYDIPDEKARNVLWLITTGDLDAGYQASMDFYQKCRGLAYPIILKAGQNLGHGGRDDMERLGLAFFEYAQGLKMNGKTAPGGAPLPVTAEVLADAMRHDLEESTLVGDFINQGVYEIGEAEWIPAAQRVPLASSKIAEVWGKKEGR